MKRILIHLSLALILLVAGCQTDRVTEPDQVSAPAGSGIDTHLAAAELIRLAGWELTADAPAAPALDKSFPCLLLDIEREVLVDDIVHYSFQIQVGPEPYGVIGLHRVVREHSPNRPIRARKSLFMLHGGGVDFVDSFMPSTRFDYMPVENCLPIFLAQNEVDVWGIDMAWTFIPGDVTDFSFAIDWGMQREIDDLHAGIEIARLVRLFTGNGWRKMDLLGWSMGEAKGYAYLNEESQRPPGHRHIKGFIPIDSAVRNGVDEVEEFNCASYEALMAERENGTYVNSEGTLAQFVAYLAATDPDGDSPVFPGFTNMQVVLSALTLTGPVLGSYPPHFHLLAGVFEGDLVPIGYQYVDFAFGVDFYASWKPYQPNLIFADINAMGCPDLDVPYEQHFGDITVPIFYVAPAGGSGPLGEYMATQVGSTDFQSLIVSNNPEPLFDIGHVDIFAGYIGIDLPALMWQPILDWMLEHRAAGREQVEGVEVVVD